MFPLCEGDGAGSSGLAAGASQVCAPSGPRADPHPVPVRGAGVLRHGLSGAEEVHPSGPGSQVASRTRHSRTLLLGESGWIAQVFPGNWP